MIRGTEEPVGLEPIERIIADYERGALTDASACLEIYLAAGRGDAAAVLARLPSGLRDLVTRDVAGANADGAGLVESVCTGSPPEAYVVDLRRREEAMRRGIVALQGLIGSQAASPAGREGEE